MAKKIKATKNDLEHLVNYAVMMTRELEQAKTNPDFNFTWESLEDIKTPDPIFILETWEEEIDDLHSTDEKPPKYHVKFVKALGKLYRGKHGSKVLNGETKNSSEEKKEIKYKKQTDEMIETIFDLASSLVLYIRGKGPIETFIYNHIVKLRPWITDVYSDIDWLKDSYFLITEKSLTDMISKYIDETVNSINTVDREDNVNDTKGDAFINWNYFNRIWPHRRKHFLQNLNTHE